MTDQDIEKIARAYCAKLGLDPDEMVNGYPLWAHHRYTVRVSMTEEAIAMREAIAEVLGKGDAG